MWLSWIHRQRIPPIKAEASAVGTGSAVSERRRHFRYPAVVDQARVRWRHDDGTSDEPACLVDISRGGARLVADIPLPGGRPSRSPWTSPTTSPGSRRPSSASATAEASAIWSRSSSSDPAPTTSSSGPSAAPNGPRWPSPNPQAEPLAGRNGDSGLGTYLFLTSHHSCGINHHRPVDVGWADRSFFAGRARPGDGPEQPLGVLRPSAAAGRAGDGPEPGDDPAPLTTTHYLPPTTH